VSLAIDALPLPRNRPPTAIEFRQPTLAAAGELLAHGQAVCAPSPGQKTVPVDVPVSTIVNEPGPPGSDTVPPICSV
jgi:hypothetical protein